MEISRLSPDDEVGCADAVALLSAAAKLDCPEALLPTPRSYAANLKHGWDGDPGQAFLARDEGGVAVGLLGLHVPTYDNTHLAWAEVGVHPGHRGRGIGSELLGYGEQLACALGRTSLRMDNWDLPKANAFSLWHGFEQKAVEVNRRQDIAGVDWSVVRRLYDEAVRASTGYELLQVSGQVPEELLDGMVELTASINDAPKDELDIKDKVLTPERLRAYEAAQEAHNRKIYRVVAEDGAGGQGGLAEDPPGVRVVDLGVWAGQGLGVVCVRMRIGRGRSRARVASVQVDERCCACRRTSRARGRCGRCVCLRRTSCPGCGGPPLRPVVADRVGYLGWPARSGDSRSGSTRSRG